MKNIFFNDEFRKAASDRALFMLENGLLPKVESTPQKIIVTLLKEMKIKFIIEKIFGKFSIDIWLQDYNLCIEIMGDFWHSNPNKFSIIKYFSQKDRIKRDKAKNTYITKNLYIPILYLWEEDIYNDLQKCKELIKLFISSNGLLENYESFNYLLEKDRLKLQNEIIKSYREYSIEELRKIINLKNMHTNND